MNKNFYLRLTSSKSVLKSCKRFVAKQLFEFIMSVGKAN